MYKNQKNRTERTFIISQVKYMTYELTTKNNNQLQGVMIRMSRSIDFGLRPNLQG